jgi:hypothetical protein
MSNPDEKTSNVNQKAETAGSNAAADVISYFSLFNCDALDYVGVTIGVLGALANAPVMPMFAFIFGEVRSCTCIGAACDWSCTYAGLVACFDCIAVAEFMP